MKILMLGDVVSREGCDYLNRSRRLASFVRENRIDLVIANGENSAEGNGITPQSMESLWQAGVDVITGGNHTWRRKEIKNALEDEERLLRPANYPDPAEGHGYTIVEAGTRNVLVMNLMGCAGMDSLESPFLCADRILKAEKGRYDLSVVDFHAEMTSEKWAMARYLDGRVTVLAGTHTHVQTADETVLPGGTGYITDLGMCGSFNGILGVKTEPILHSFLVKTPVLFEPASGCARANGCVFQVNDVSGRCESVQRAVF